MTKRPKLLLTADLLCLGPMISTVWAHVAQVPNVSRQPMQPGRLASSTNEGSSGVIFPGTDGRRINLHHVLFRDSCWSSWGENEGEALWQGEHDLFSYRSHVCEGCRCHRTVHVSPLRFYVPSTCDRLRYSRTTQSVQGPSTYPRTKRITPLQRESEVGHGFHLFLELTRCTI